MQKRLSLRQARRHFARTPSVTSTVLAEPRTESDLAAVLFVRDQSTSRPLIAVDDAIRALEVIAACEANSRALEPPYILECLGGIGLIRARGMHCDLTEAGRDVLTDAQRWRRAS